MASLEQHLWRSIFCHLDINNIQYCLVGKYSNLTDLDSNVVDLLITRDQLNVCERIVEDVISQLGWDKFYPVSGFGCHPVVFYRTESHNCALVKLNFWTRLSWKGIDWSNLDYILSTREARGDVYIPRPGAQAVILAVQELLSHGEVPSQNRGCLSKLARADQEGFVKSLNLPSARLANEIYSWICRDQWDNLNRASWAVKKSLLTRLIEPGSLDGFCRFLGKGLISSSKMILKPPGGLIAFMGPDGAGKSTVINMVVSRLAPLFPRTKVYHKHYNFFDFLPALGKVRGKYARQVIHQYAMPVPGVRTDSSSTKKPTLRHRVLLWLVLSYRTLEFWLGYIKIWSTGARSGLVIFDRYFYEFFIFAPYRDMIWPYRKILLAIVPTPKSTIYLQASPEIIHARKQELPVEEIASQQVFFSSILPDIENAHVVNAERSLAEIETEVCAIIMKALGHIV